MKRDQTRRAHSSAIRLNNIPGHCLRGCDTSRLRSGKCDCLCENLASDGNIASVGCGERSGRLSRNRRSIALWS